VFSVDILEEGNVRVDVEEGRVSVDDGARKLDLHAGEQMRVKASPVIAQAESSLQQPLVDSQAQLVSKPKPDRPKTKRRHRRRARTRAVQPVQEKKPKRLLAYTSSASFRDIPHISEQLAKLDAARQAGRLAEAAAILRAIIRDHKNDARLVTAWFLLGRIESTRGKFVLAARAFRTCQAQAPRGPLVEDALAEEAAAWAAAGDHEQARNLAQQYLNQHPSGTHLKRMGALAR
jgi:TolA-binding protein